MQRITKQIYFIF